MQKRVPTGRLRPGGFSRRSTMRTLGGFVLAGGLLPGVALAQNALAVPDGPLKLSRRIERSLRDGEWISVDRSWIVRFAPQAQGLSITGEQFQCRVAAPPSLAPLATIEEERSTADMWPIMLTGSGMIVAAGEIVRGEDVAEAVRVAERMIAQRDPPSSQKDARSLYLAELGNASSSLLDRLPDDLFYPTIGPIRTQRSIDLPDGQKGEFELLYEAKAVPGKGWLDRAERQVITRLGGTAKFAREQWTLVEL